MLGSFAQFENDRRAERIKAGINEKRKITGLQKIGGKNSLLNPEPITMRETDEWFKLYKEGAGIRKIATEFKRHRTTVHNILVKKRKTIDVSDSFRS
jgi:DNA invertase Pin-like site-specific DNA recombinase